MIAYSYDKESSAYIGTTSCQIDPLASKKEGKVIYLLPANSTFIKPPIYNLKTETPIWSENEWVIKQNGFQTKEDVIEQPELSSKELEEKVYSIINFI